MTVSINQLASDVAILLGEALARECRPHESPFPDVEDKVRVMAPGLLEELIMKARPEDLTDSKRASPPVTIDRSGIVSLSLPEDYLRAVYIRMSDWKRPVTQVTGPSDPGFDRQSSPWHGIRGSLERPVAIEGVGKTGARILQLFSSGSDATLDSFIYSPRPALGATDALEIPMVLYPTLLNELMMKLGAEV